MWLYGGGTATLELEPTAPGRVTVIAAGGPPVVRTAAAGAVVEVELGGVGWHALVVRARPGLRLVDATLR